LQVDKYHPGDHVKFLYLIHNRHLSPQHDFPYQRLKHKPVPGIRHKLGDRVGSEADSGLESIWSRLRAIGGFALRVLASTTAIPMYRGGGCQLQVMHFPSLQKNQLDVVSTNVVALAQDVVENPERPNGETKIGNTD
jgi:hypothetical protein